MAPEESGKASETDATDATDATALRQQASASPSGEENSQERGDRPGNPNGQQQAVVAAAENAPLFDAAITDDTSSEAAPETRATAEAKVESPAARDALPSPADKGAAGRAAASSAGEAPGVSQGERVDAARFIGRVGRAFETAHQRGDVVRIRLSPPELGAMQIKLAVSAEGAMTASVETETNAARNLLLDNLPALRERLAGMEIRVEKFDVDVRQDGGGKQDQWNRGDGEPRRDGEGRTLGHDSRSQQPAAAGAAQITPTAGPAGADQINLVI